MLKKLKRSKATPATMAAELLVADAIICKNHVSNNQLWVASVLMGLNSL